MITSLVGDPVHVHLSFVGAFRISCALFSQKMFPIRTGHCFQMMLSGFGWIRLMVLCDALCCRVAIGVCSDAGWLI